MIQKKTRLTAARKEKLLADLEKYRQMALKMGADDVRILRIPEDFSQRIRARMGDVFPRAASGGFSYFGFPTFHMPWQYAKAVISAYHYAILARIPTREDLNNFTGPTAVGALNDYWIPKYKKFWGEDEAQYWQGVQDQRHGRHLVGLQPAISKAIEDEARKDGHHFASSGFSGSCSRLCYRPFGPTCLAIQTGICRHPGKTRMQGTAATFGIDHPAIYAKLGLQNWVQGWSVFPEDYPKGEIDPPPARTAIVFIE